MRNSRVEIEGANARAALRDAECKGKLCVVSAVTGISEKRLRDILNGEFDIPDFERTVLLSHIAA